MCSVAFLGVTSLKREVTKYLTLCLYFSWLNLQQLCGISPFFLSCPCSPGSYHWTFCDGVCVKLQFRHQSWGSCLAEGKECPSHLLIYRFRAIQMRRRLFQDTPNLGHLTPWRFLLGCRLPSRSKHLPHDISVLSSSRMEKTLWCQCHDNAAHHPYVGSCT